MGHTGSCKPNSSIWIWGSIQLHIHVSLVTILDEEGLAKYFNAPEKKKPITMKNPLELSSLLFTFERHV